MHPPGDFGPPGKDGNLQAANLWKFKYPILEQGEVNVMNVVNME